MLIFADIMLIFADFSHFRCWYYAAAFRFHYFRHYHYFAIDIFIIDIFDFFIIFFFRFWCRFSIIDISFSLAFIRHFLHIFFFAFFSYFSPLAAFLFWYHIIFISFLFFWYFSFAMALIDIVASLITLSLMPLLLLRHSPPCLSLFHITTLSRLLLFHADISLILLPFFAIWLSLMPLLLISSSAYVLMMPIDIFIDATISLPLRLWFHYYAGLFSPLLCVTLLRCLPLIFRWLLLRLRWCHTLILIFATLLICSLFIITPRRYAFDYWYYVAIAWCRHYWFHSLSLLRHHFRWYFRLICSSILRRWFRFYRCFSPIAASFRYFLFMMLLWLSPLLFAAIAAWWYADTMIFRRIVAVTFIMPRWEPIRRYVGYDVTYAGRWCLAVDVRFHATITRFSLIDFPFAAAFDSRLIFSLLIRHYAFAIFLFFATLLPYACWCAMQRSAE